MDEPSTPQPAPHPPLYGPFGAGPYEWDQHPWERNRLRSEIRIRVDTRLAEVSGRDKARMRWNDADFLKFVVDGLRCHIPPGHWPQDIPFAHPSNIRGGSASLRRIRDRLVSGELQIVRLDEDGFARFSADPDGFLPNTTLRAPRGPIAGSAGPDPFRVVPSVLHPHDMHDLSRPSTVGESLPVAGSSSGSSNSPWPMTTTKPAKIPRRQRSDIKKRRHCPVTNPERRPPRRPRPGVKTPQYVYETADGSAVAGGDELASMGVVLSDEYVEMFWN